MNLRPDVIDNLILLALTVGGLGLLLCVGEIIGNAIEWFNRKPDSRPRGAVPRKH